MSRSRCIFIGEITARTAQDPLATLRLIGFRTPNYTFASVLRPIAGRKHEEELVGAHPGPNCLRPGPGRVSLRHPITSRGLRYARAFPPHCLAQSIQIGTYAPERAPRPQLGEESAREVFRIFPSSAIPEISAPASPPSHLPANHRRKRGPPAALPGSIDSGHENTQSRALPRPISGRGAHESGTCAPHTKLKSQQLAHRVPPLTSRPTDDAHGVLPPHCLAQSIQGTKIHN